MKRQRVVKELIRFGKHLDSTDDPGDLKGPAKRFVESDPNAWLFAVILDQGIKYRNAWAAPYELKLRLGHFNIRRLATTPIAELRKAVKGPVGDGKALTRYVQKLPVWLKRAAQKIIEDYKGDASLIWRECRTSEEVIERLKEFVGISEKKANMAARLLLEEWGATFSRGGINVAVDSHVMRVWKRAGLGRDRSIRGIMRAAKDLKPDYPGELDYPIWKIGSGWCHPREPDCRGLRHPEGKRCPISGVCAKEGIVSGR